MLYGLKPLILGLVSHPSFLSKIEADFPQVSEHESRLENTPSPSASPRHAAASADSQT